MGHTTPAGLRPEERRLALADLLASMVELGLSPERIAANVLRLERVRELLAEARPRSHTSASDVATRARSDDKHG